MNDFKRNNRFGERPSFGRKPGYQRSGGGFGGRPQGQMHQATCAQCGKSCEVPFRPDGSRPIYCRDCFGSNKPSASAREFQRPSFKTPASVQQKPQVPDPRIDTIQKQLGKMEVKLDQILVSLAVAKAQTSTKPAVAKKKKPARKK